jgi:hypothetical protein
VGGDKKSKVLFASEMTHKLDYCNLNEPDGAEIGSCRPKATFEGSYFYELHGAMLEDVLLDDSVHA